MPETNEEIYNNARNALYNVRARHSIGHRSAALKRNHLFKKLGRAALGVGAVLVGASVIGGIISGLGFWGVMATALAIGGVTWVTMNYPKMKIPTPETLVQSDLKTLAGKTEIWLETQRPMLPPPAAKIVDGIGVQLDMLAPQLQKLNEGDTAAYEIKKLMGEHLPELISGYRAIPASMRQKAEDGDKSPDDKLVGGLELIEKEISGVTKQIAKGDLDNFSIRGRYLEMKYDQAGEAEA